MIPVFAVQQLPHQTNPPCEACPRKRFILGTRCGIFAPPKKYPLWERISLPTRYRQKARSNLGSVTCAAEGNQPQRAGINEVGGSPNPVANMSGRDGNHGLELR